jgi:hypothetical protein
MEAAVEEGHAGHGIGKEGHPGSKEDRGLLTAQSHGQAEYSEIPQMHHAHRRKVQGAHSDVFLEIGHKKHAARWYSVYVHQIGKKMWGRY